MKLAANIKLECSDAQHKSLLNTLEVCNAACDYISSVAWDKRVFGQYALHKLCYQDVKQKFSLNAQMTVRSIAKVADAYKLDKKTIRKFRKRAAQPYDDRIFKITKDNKVSISAIDGREKIDYICGDYQKELLKTRKGEVDLMYIRGIFYVACVCDVNEQSNVEPEGVLGIDLGIVNIAVDSTGKHYSGKDIDIYRKKMANRRKNLQKKGTRSAKRKLKQISGKQKRYQKDRNHCISKDIVATAKRLSSSIALEDLGSIREGIKARKSQRARMGNWGFHQLKSFVKYKAQLLGISVVEVDPKNTSRTCPQCQFVSKANRKTRDTFCCKQCDFSESADLVAAWNIQAKAVVNQPMVARMAC